MLEGSVHGVVVHMIVQTFLSLNRGSIFSGALVSLYRTYTLGDVCISYSTSASASAVWSWEHQYTGFRPL